MPRASRVVILGLAHHVTQRGNNRQDIFFVDDDRRVFLDMLRQAACRFGLTIDGYCLMTNHVHLVAVPKNEDSLFPAFKRVNQLYTQYVNRLHGRSGHLWQGRFFSCCMDEPHRWSALIYIERNPVRAKLVRRAWQYPWSSAAAHCGQADTSGLLHLGPWRQAVPGDAWRENLTAVQDAGEIEHLRLASSRGRPLGSDSFLSKLENKLGRRLRALPIGRPKQEGQAK